MTAVATVQVDDHRGHPLEGAGAGEWAGIERAAGDERLPATFLVLNTLRGGGGFPRQAKFGVRFQF